MRMCVLRLLPLTLLFCGAAYGGAAPHPAAPPVRDAAWRKTQIDYLKKIDQTGLWRKAKSGLRYRCIGETKPNAPQPTSGSDVFANYRVTLPSGRQLDSSKPGVPMRIPLAKTIPGFRQGVEMMHQGEICEFVIPYYLGYGKKGGGPVPGGATLIFRVELVRVGSRMPRSK